jgi:hypothetical protein
MPSEDIIKKIKALRAKVNNAASTEAEVEAAARLVAKLMMQHDVTEDLLKETVAPQAVDVGTGSVMKNDIDILMSFCWREIQEFTETKAYRHVKVDGSKEFHFIGLPHDVEMATYLYELVTMSAKRAWLRYSASLFDSGEALRTKDRRKSFYQAFGLTIGEMMQELSDQRAKMRSESATGTAVVIRKQDLIKAQMASTGLALRKSRSYNIVGRLNENAFGAGRDAASKVNLGRPFDKNRSAGSIR